MEYVLIMQWAVPEVKIEGASGESGSLAYILLCIIFIIPNKNMKQRSEGHLTPPCPKSPYPLQAETLSKSICFGSTPKRCLVRAAGRCQCFGVFAGLLRALFRTPHYSSCAPILHPPPSPTDVLLSMIGRLVIVILCQGAVVDIQFIPLGSTIGNEMRENHGERRLHRFPLHLSIF